MPEPLRVGDLYKSLNAQAEASQKIYKAIVDLTDIDTNLNDEMSKKNLERILQELVKVADDLSKNVDDTTKLVQKSLEPAR